MTSTSLLKKVTNLGSPAVLLAGDFMLDSYLYGDALRISPEAPVQVLKVMDRQYCAGGAASVAADIIALGGRCICVGVSGEDAEGGRLLGLLEEMGADWTGNPDKTDILEDILKQEPDGLDMVFECCGQQEAADQAVRLLKPGGRLMVIGIPEFPRWSFEADDFRRKEISVQNVRRQNEVTGLTLDMISKGTIRPGRMQTHTFGFDRAEEAFDLVAGYRDGVMKAMIRLS